jgi:hypothetical protein
MEDEDHHSAAVLVDALEHVTYEVWKYRQSVADYRKLVNAGAEVAVEFRALHNWSLLEFLFGPPRNADLIVASEYISDWQLTHDRAALPWLDPYVARCHTMLSPISTGRVAMGNAGLKHWNQHWPDIEPHIDRAISEFLNALSDHHKSICLQWIDRWFRPGAPGSKELMEIASALGRSSSQ